MLLFRLQIDINRDIVGNLQQSSITIEDIVIKINFPEKYYNSNIIASEGDFQFINNKLEKNSIILWEIKNIKLHLNKENTLPYLKGNISHENEFKSESNSLTLSCKLSNYSATGFSITKMNVIKDKNNLQPFKGGMLHTNINNLEIIF